MISSLPTQFYRNSTDDKKAPTQFLLMCLPGMIITDNEPTYGPKAMILTAK